MLLAEKDITRLVKKGFKTDFFVKCDKQGYCQLKNRDGYCVFYDLENRKCSVYFDRPSGCRVYPVIFDEDKGLVLDDICPETGTIGDEEKNLKGKKVMKLLDIIDDEAAKRHP